MQFRDLSRQYEALKPSIDDAIARVLSTGRFIMGQEVAQLEQALSSRLAIQHSVACASGTDALRMALMVWNIVPGDAVFVPDFTFFATAEVVALQGATPIFVDVDSRTFNIDAEDLQHKIESVRHTTALRPRAIIAVDLFGLPANYAQLRRIADEYQLLILEDAAQGFGGMIDRRQACTFGDISTTSFFPAKPLGCYGDGGALFTDNDTWASQARSLLQHGRGDHKYQHISVGLNSRLDALQAAILHTKLQAFDSELFAVRQVADRYSKALSDLVIVPQTPDTFQSAWAQYTICLQTEVERDALCNYFTEQGVPSMIYYPTPLHLQPVFQELLASSADCPTATQLSQTVLSLPIHPYLTSAEQDIVINTVRQGLSIIRNR